MGLTFTWSYPTAPRPTCADDIRTLIYSRTSSVVDRRATIERGPRRVMGSNPLTTCLSRGFTDIAARIAIRGLERMGLVEAFTDSDQNQDFTAYRVTDGGLDWLEQNQDKLALRYQAATSAPAGGGDRSVLVLNINPKASALEASFDPAASYELKIDIDGDFEADVAFHVVFGSTSDRGSTASVYRSTFNISCRTW